MLNLNALVYFVETARLRSFTQAAHTLGVSQSTVSKMVKNLENDLGDVLIVRQSTPLKLTAIGEHLYKKGQHILQAITELEHDVHAMQSLKMGRLRIGIPPMVNLLLTHTLKQFRERYPDIALVINEPPGPMIEKEVAAGRLDFGFSIAPVEQGLALKQEVFADFPLYAIAQQHVIDRLNNPLTLAQLANKNLLLLNEDFGITRLLNLHFAKANVTPTIYAQSSQWDWLISMAQAGLGIALLPEPFTEQLPAGMACRQIEDPTLRWQVVLLWDALYLSDSEQAWLEMC